MHDLSALTITRIDSAVLLGTRRRVIGCNAKLPTHGQYVREPVVRLHTSEGLVGWGWSRATRDDAEALLGRSLSDVFDVHSGSAEAFLKFDFPLWDLAGRALGKSVHELLGDEGCDPVPVYDGSIYIEEIDPDTGQDSGIEPVLAAVEAGMTAGFRALKVKVGRGFRWMDRQAGLQRDVAVLQAIRSLTGPDVVLLIDANNGHSPEEARDIMHQAGDCDIHWFEEPFPEDTGEDLAFKRFLRDAGHGTLIADGEGAEGREAEFTEIVRGQAVDVVQFDMRGFTLTRWLKYLPVIEATGTLAAPHNWGSHLAGFYVQQFARGCPRFAMAEIDAMTVPGVEADGYRMRDGKGHVPESPGFGLELGSAAFAGAQREYGGWEVTAD